MLESGNAFDDELGTHQATGGSRREQQMSNRVLWANSYALLEATWELSGRSFCGLTARKR